MVDWRKDAEESKFIRLDEGMYTNVVIDTEGVEKDVNQFGKVCWDFPCIEFNDKGIATPNGKVLRVTSKRLLGKIGQIAKGDGIFECRIKRIGSGIETDYEVAGEVLDQTQTRFESD